MSKGPAWPPEGQLPTPQREHRHERSMEPGRAHSPGLSQREGEGESSFSFDFHFSTPTWFGHDQFDNTNEADQGSMEIDDDQPFTNPLYSTHCEDIDLEWLRKMPNDLLSVEPAPDDFFYPTNSNNNSNRGHRYVYALGRDGPPDGNFNIGGHDNHPEHGAGVGEEEDFLDSPEGGVPENEENNQPNQGGDGEEEPWEVNIVRDENGTHLRPEGWPNETWYENNQLYYRDPWIHPDWRLENKVWVLCETCQGFWWVEDHPYAREREYEARVLPQGQHNHKCHTCGGWQFWGSEWTGRKAARGWHHGWQV